MPKYSTQSVEYAILQDLKCLAEGGNVEAQFTRRNSRMSRAHRLDSMLGVAKQQSREYIPQPVALSSREMLILLTLIEQRMAGGPLPVEGFPVTGTEWMTLIRKLFHA